MTISEFINPSLSYLMQYPVNRVVPAKDGSTYEIEFQGNAVIKVRKPEDGDIVVPEINEGMVLVTTEKSVSGTTIVFGTVDRKGNFTSRCDVNVGVGEYDIIDPRFGGSPFTPDAPQIETDRVQTIREQFEGRFAESGEVQPDGDPPENVVEAVQDENAS